MYVRTTWLSVQDLSFKLSIFNSLLNKHATFTEKTAAVSFSLGVDVIAKMDSSQHTVLTNFIIFSYRTAVNIYKKILKKMLIQIKILPTHYHS